MLVRPIVFCRSRSVHIDDALIAKALTLTGATTKREVVDLALRHLVEKRTLYRAIRKLRGRLVWEGDVTASRASWVAVRRDRR